MMSHRRQPRITCAVRDFMDSYKLKNEQLCDLMKKIRNDLDKGLAAETHETSPVKCYQTYIQELPTGNETGRYLVLDLSGMSFRVMRVTLSKDHHFEMDSRTYSFPIEKTQGNADEFFDFIAECMDLFLDEFKMKSENLALGFSFGFPVKLESLTRGILVNWSKKFNVSGVVGEDVVGLLQLAFDKRSLKINPIIIINDTIGCLLSCSWKEHRCRVGVIIGTGTNACYIEKIENVGTFNGDPTKPYMIINTEWSNFGSDGSLDDIRNSFDEEVDKSSTTPGIQIYEKMTSSLYLSELVRVTVLKCAKLKFLFEGETSEMLHRPMTFLPEFIYEIEGDSTHELNRTLGVLEVMRLKNISLQDCVNVKYICKIICRRSAHLIAAGISAIVNKVALSPTTIAFDGNIYRKHPKYKETLREKVKGMINPLIQVEFILSEDGSGKGAALVMAQHKNKVELK